jgi:signal transduction histidine kinase
VSCDRERVQQVLLNLIGNAIEFSPAAAGVTVSVEARGVVVVVGVIDEGPGIAASAVPHVFDRYWQLEARGPGTVGLGLSICKALVSAHGGDIWVESEAGRGSSFFFSLPAAAA